MDRQHALLVWTQEVLQDSECYIKPASHDASFRSYWRVFSKGQTFIIMDAPPEHENCIPFIEISKKLNDSLVFVPEVIAQNLDKGFLLLTDLGNVQYLSILNDDNCQELYSDALKALHTIQKDTSLADLPSYNRSLLMNELDLFEQWFVNIHLDTQLNAKQKETVNLSKKLLIENALTQPQVFVHRDYHSRNLMKTKNRNPGILDFQDAVIGPVTYDLVSLLKDCYICWDEALVNQLSDDFRLKYNASHHTQFTTKQWQKWFDLMGLQRHLKVVGIFCRLNYRDKKSDYLKDLNLTLCYIKQACSKYQEFEPLLNLIKQITPSIDSLCKS
jgi:aminoglycoside/choline kinase family phosphotransferase